MKIKKSTKYVLALYNNIGELLIRENIKIFCKEQKLPYKGFYYAHLRGLKYLNTAGTKNTIFNGYELKRLSNEYFPI